MNIPRNALALSAVSTAAAAAACLGLLALSLPAHAADTVCASVEVQNVRPKQGRLMVASFLSADSYRKSSATSMNLAAGDDATMRFQLCGLSGTEVALTLFQDLDSNGKLDTNLIGIPSEPWGASGSPGMTGPKWETTRVPLDGQTVVVKMSK